MVDRRKDAQNVDTKWGCLPYIFMVVLFWIVLTITDSLVAAILLALVLTLFASNVEGFIRRHRR